MATGISTLGTFLNNVTGGAFLKRDDQQFIGIGGYNMLVHARQRITRTADAPTSYLEDGSFANDHIILNPIKIEVEGWTTDIIERSSPVVDAIVATNDNLGIITKYTGLWTEAQRQKITSLATTALDINRKINDMISDGRELLSLFSPRDPSRSNTEQFLSDMEYLYTSRIPFPVEVEGQVFEDMCMVQWATDFDNELSIGVKYSMTFQQIRYVEIAYSEAKPASSPASNLGGQTGVKVSKGVNEGTKRSMWSSLARTIGGR